MRGSVGPCIGQTRARGEAALVFVVVTVQAEQLPVASIRWIVVVIMVAVMDREFMHVGASEFPRATAADPRIHFQSLFPVSLLAFGTVPPGIRHNLIQLVGS